MKWLQRAIKRREWRRKPPAPPLCDFTVTVEVLLHHPIPLEGSRTAIGYYRGFGLRCSNQEVVTIVETLVDDGAIVRGSLEIHTTDRARVSGDEIVPLEPDEVGVWSRSERAYYSRKDD